MEKSPEKVESLNVEKPVERIKIDLSEVSYRCYQKTDSIRFLMEMIQGELSEPYSIFLYRYFIENFPKLAILAIYKEEIIGVIIGKIEEKSKRLRGYIAMLTVLKKFRGNGIALELVYKLCQTIEVMGGHEIILETECVNIAALSLYEKAGFMREKKLNKYYQNGNDAYRLKKFTANLDKKDNQDEN